MPHGPHLRRPEIGRPLGWIWQAYWWIDRSDWGAIRFGGMRSVLDELGIHEPWRRERLIRIWYAMAHAEREARERVSPTKKDGDGEARS